MTKYSTQRQYQAYIDIIMDDLGLTDKVAIEWRFAKFKSFGGQATLNKYSIGKIWIDNECDHANTLRIIMHELRHIHQYYNDRLSRNGVTIQKKTKHGIKYISGRTWDGIPHEQIKLTRGVKTSSYDSQPWEVDALAYEKEVKRLFPNGKIQRHEYIGHVGNIKFYKVKEEA